MAGPHPPNPTVGGGGPPPQPAPLEYPGNYVAHPRPRRRRLIIGVLVAVALMAATTVAIVYGVRTNGANTTGTFSEGPVKTSIQQYLDALAHHDVDTIERNALCGLYDGVRDRRSDQALAKLSSDAFRKQFSEVQVTAIDKIVYLSQDQAQALFTMKVSPVAGGPMRGQVQGIAQLLLQRNQILVCSYVLRTANSVS
ncbi:Rv0361 family membrane protein [Mycobacterium conspicuum]|uniref:DUF8174 domain-containing protein n=1 Tax=Mycobacterium conspicuum TaxID=44010 RepID=A0A1X1TCS6_9MYCO|nr:hypothetical protein [Mycobacterium conspicuum]ORV42336.1 hypothetical protein AWC00_12670 [Mycobacterium conspicuum]BBZ40112.1 hypothetical protein MCNS_31750 [Mycobacterium conspicuum]